MIDRHFQCGKFLLTGVTVYLYLVLLLSYGLTATLIAGLPLHSMILVLGLSLSWSALPGLPVFMLLPPILLLYGMIRLLVGQISFFAFRDMGTLLEMQWIFVGYALARHGIIEAFLRRLTFYMLPCVLYWNLFSFGAVLKGLGPRTGLHNTGLLGTFNQVHVPPIYFAAAAIFHDRLRRPTVSVVMSLLFMLRSMSRHAIGGFLLVSLWLAARRLIDRRLLIWSVLISCGVLILILFYDVEIRTRFGNLGEVFVRLYRLVFGSGDVEVFERGFSQRFEWWSSGIANTCASPWTTLFGQGFGVVLTDHAVVAGIPTRELHNSWISLFCRTGLVGLTTFTSYVWWLSATILRPRSGLDRLANLYVCLMIMVLMSSLFEPAFENPNIASLIWVSIGAFLHQRVRADAHLPGA